MGGVDSESFADELVDNVEQLEAARVGGLVELEVQRPYVVGHLARSLVAVPSVSRRRLARRWGGCCRSSSR